MYIQAMQRLLLSILLLAVFLTGIAQTRSSRPLPRQKKSSTSAVTRQRELSPREIVRLAFPSSASIYVLDEDGNSYSGAGFVVAPGVVATCYHVVENARRIVVTPMGNSEDRHNARLLRYDDERDLALLAVKTLKGKPLKLTEETDFYIGETIYTLVTPKDLKGHSRTGFSVIFFE
jgi:S1-C subfamily serine protease